MEFQTLRLMQSSYRILFNVYGYFNLELFHFRKLYFSLTVYNDFEALNSRHILQSVNKAT